MRSRLLVTLVLLLAFFTSNTVAKIATPAAGEPLRFVFLSDFHLDLYYGESRGFPPCNTSSNVDGSPFGKFGCDAPLALTQSALADIRRNGEPEYLLAAGDWLRHDMKELSADDALATFVAVTRQLASAFHPSRSKTSLFLHPSPKNFATTFGNNDVVPSYNFGDLADAVLGKHTPLFNDMVQALVNEGLLANGTESQAYGRCGFYGRRFVSRTSQKGLRVLGINSLIWVEKLRPRPATSPDPCHQFAFLREHINEARRMNDSIWILGHIPPTINEFDVYSHPQWNASTNASHYYQEQYETQFLDLLRSSSDVVKALIFGHTHHVAFCGDPSVGVPMYTLGAITPIYRNWPNYFDVSVDEQSFEIFDLRQRYLNLTEASASGVAVWRDGLSLANAYSTPDSPKHPGEEPISVAYLSSVGRQILSGNTSTYRTWRTFNTGGDPNLSFCVSDFCRTVDGCLSTNLGTKQVFECINRRKKEVK